MKRTRHQRALMVESLETRNLLAGVVTVKVSGGLLEVEGDNQANAIIIRRTGSGTYEVEGINDASAVATTIKGIGANGTKTVTGVKDGFDIHLKGGNDILGIGNNDTLLNDLQTELAGGSDTIGGATVVAADLTIVPKRLEIDMGGGNDAVGLFVKVGKSLDIDLAAGNNSVAIESSTIGDDLLVDSGKGTDSLRVRKTAVHDLLFANLGGGVDALNVVGSSAGHADLHLGSGSDTAEIDTTHVSREIIVHMDSGNDQLAFTTNTGKTARLFGDDGTDTLTSTGNTFHKLKKSSFT